MSSNNRRKKFIDPKVQGALIRRICFHYVIFFGTAATLSFFLQMLTDPLASFSVHFDKLWLTHGPFLITGACLLPVFLYDTVTLSHRFVGPILRVRNTVKEAGYGKETPPITLRPHDFWTDLADDMNGLLQRINGLSTPAKEQEELVGS